MQLSYKSTWGSDNVDTGGELSSTAWNSDFMWPTSTEECGFCEFATSVDVGIRPT